MSLHISDIAPKIWLIESELDKLYPKPIIAFDNKANNTKAKRGMPMIFKTFLSFGLSYSQAIKARIGKIIIKGMIT